MNLAYINLLVYMVILTVLAVPFGKYMVCVFSGKIKFLSFIEKLLYKMLGVESNAEMNWKEYAINVMVFSIVGVIFLFFIEFFQSRLPLNPQKFGDLSWDLAINTAISFVGNTNWQAYSGETTMSYFTQMAGLVVQNFMSGAVGISVAIAFIRGFTSFQSQTIGNFWHDLVKSILYILLPLSLIVAIILVGLGVPQNFSSYKTVQVLDPQIITSVVNGKSDSQIINTQIIPMGPVASQEAIKMLGTNGGGFFNANSAHPYENPSALSNFLEMIIILLIPAALCFVFGSQVGDKQQGYTLYAVMGIVFTALALMELWAESHGNPLFTQFHINQLADMWQSGGNMEGKETRFGIISSGIFAAITTAASCGAVNAMHDSLMPLGGFVPLFLMQMSEVIYGGIGSGLYGILIFAILAVFIAGLMIGRTPEYLGKKIESFEMRMVSLAILLVPFLVLGGTAISVLIASGLAGMSNPSAHGLSEVLYGFTSAANNNGSAFGGLNANTQYYNLMLAVAIFFGRFGVIIPVLAIAGSLAIKKRLPVTQGTMPTSGVLFASLLIGTVVIVGVLTYIPSLALGPIVEHLTLFK